MTKSILLLICILQTTMLHQTASALPLHEIMETDIINNEETIETDTITNEEANLDTDKEEKEEEEEKEFTEDEEELTEDLLQMAILAETLQNDSVIQEAEENLELMEDGGQAAAADTEEEPEPEVQVQTPPLPSPPFSTIGGHFDDKHFNPLRPLIGPLKEKWAQLTTYLTHPNLGFNQWWQKLNEKGSQLFSHGFKHKAKPTDYPFAYRGLTSK